MSAAPEREGYEDAHGSGELPVTPQFRLMSPRPRRASRLARMPRWLRIPMSGWAFAMFFGATLILGMFAVPIIMLMRNRPEHRWRFTHRLNASLRLFSGFIRDSGLIDYWPPLLPPELEGRPFLLVSNHPSLIDVVLTLSSFPQLTCVAKAEWYGSFLMGPLLRRTELIPGPGYEGDEEADDDLPVVRRIEEKLRAGVPVLVFPEGSRSLADRLRRFRRGAIEAAVRAQVPILPMFIGVSHPYLMKGVPFWHVPDSTPLYTFEQLPVIETAGKTSRDVARDLTAHYEARFDALLAERER
ncbi:MAG: lysophospholipid acyltransferase family protein [Sandaracinaceae bacterium]|nr:MAG: 1-acyl-sn-glycerol-3-phosphate acyltransferase [Sandaracinaceae bacterium]